MSPEAGVKERAPGQTPALRGPGAQAARLTTLLPTLLSTKSDIKAPTMVSSRGRILGGTSRLARARGQACPAGRSLVPGRSWAPASTEPFHGPLPAWGSARPGPPESRECVGDPGTTHVESAPTTGKSGVPGLGGGTLL